jgi:hypothetical protein
MSVPGAARVFLGWRPHRCARHQQSVLAWDRYSRSTREDRVRASGAGIRVAWRRQPPARCINASAQPSRLRCAPRLAMAFGLGRRGMC